MIDDGPELLVRGRRSFRQDLPGHSFSSSLFSSHLFHLSTQRIENTVS